jgi:hypothetical protein
MRALKFIVAVEAATLAVVVAFVLHSESHETFPPAVASSKPIHVEYRAIPLSVAVGRSGTVTTAATLSLTRGGHASAPGAPRVAQPPTREAGSVGFRTARSPARVQRAPRASSAP